MNTSKLLQLVPVASRGLLPRTGSLVNLTPRRNRLLPTRRDPFEEMHRSMDRMVDLMFDRFFTSPYFSRPTSTTIPIETYDKEKGMLRIEVDLPNFAPEDIQVTIQNGQLEIVAKSETKGGEVKEARQLQYTYTLPEKAEVDKARSLLQNDGRLVIETPLPLSEIEAREKAALGNTEIPVKKR